MLLEAGADPNAPSDNQNTPLHFASRTNNAQAALLLLEHKKPADLTAKNCHNKTPMDVAQKRTTQTLEVQAVLIEFTKKLIANKVAKDIVRRKNTSSPTKTPEKESTPFEL
jgi:ankyrin repeat protein